MKKRKKLMFPPHRPNVHFSAKRWRRKRRELDDEVMLGRMSSRAADNLAGWS